MLNNIKTLLEKILTPGQLRIVKKIRKLYHFHILSHLYSSDLERLSLIYNADKWACHWYAKHYESHFCHLRKKKVKLLEIGVGGYAEPGTGGNSLRMWKRYFPKGIIYGIDVYDKNKLQENRISIFKGDQGNDDFLKYIGNNIGTFDIIIDDGSHVNKDVIAAFKVLFNFLKDNGIYVIEDIQTSYWPQYGGDSENLNNPNTAISFFKSLIDGINHKEFLKPGYKPSYFDEHIVAIHFYHNHIIIYKGENNKGSVKVKNGILRSSLTGGTQDHV